MSVEGLETPERICATLMRLGLLGLNRGFYILPAAVRRMPEAEQARQAIYAADVAIRGGLDQAALTDALARFGAGVRPFAEQGCDPWNLYLRAVDPSYRKFFRAGDRRAAGMILGGKR